MKGMYNRKLSKLIISQVVKRKKDFIALTIIFLFIILIYGWHSIKTPFDLSDMSFNFISLGNFQFNSLPQTLKNLNIATELSALLKNGIKSIGRVLFCYFDLYALIKLFGQNILLWRLYRFIIMLFLLFCANKFLIKINVLYYYRIAIIGFLLLFAPVSYYMETSSFYAESEMFFMIAFGVEISNSSNTNTTLRYAILGSVLVFLSSLFRELTLVMLPALFFIVLFWHKTQIGNYEIKFKWDWKRILPYCISVLLYVFLYLLLSFIIGKDKTAYSNMVLFSLNYKLIFSKLAFYFGIGIINNYYFGSLLFIITVGISSFIGFKKKVTLSKKSSFIMLFSLIIVVVHTIIFSFIQHTSGGGLLPIFGCLIIYAILIEFIISNIPLDRKNFVKVLTIITIGFIWIFQLFETLQTLENNRAQNCAYQKTVKYISKIAPESGNIALSGFSIAPAYSFVAYVFMNGRTDNLKYALLKEDVANDNKAYVKHAEDLFNSYDPQKEYPDLIIFSNPSKTQIDREDIRINKIISESVKRFSILRTIRNKKEENVTYVVAEQLN